MTTINYNEHKLDIYSLAYELPRDAFPLLTSNSTATYKKRFDSIVDAIYQLVTLRKELRAELVWFAARVGGQGNTETLNKIEQIVKFIKILDYNLEEQGY